MVCHCLLIESERELVLVDAGFGLDDVARSRARLGTFLKLMLRPRLDRSETAIEQIKQLGFDPNDVRHVILTHLDVDHAGGISDFPWARVHVTRDEYRAAFEDSTRAERARYSRLGWARDAIFSCYQAGGEPWFGFECVRGLEGLPEDFLLVPLPGHTRGHAAVAVQLADRWLLHCGDGYFYHGEMECEPYLPRVLSLFQRFCIDDAARRHNQERLRALALGHGGEVQIFCAHDRREYDKVREASGRLGGPFRASS
jgi:glyoxylase-like metal-dependent hydrolase (beta-lactamase superfamily II)